MPAAPELPDEADDIDTHHRVELAVTHREGSPPALARPWNRRPIGGFVLDRLLPGLRVQANRFHRLGTVAKRRATAHPRLAGQLLGGAATRSFVGELLDECVIAWITGSAVCVTRTTEQVSSPVWVGD